MYCFYIIYLEFNKFNSIIFIITIIAFFVLILISKNNFHILFSKLDKYYIYNIKKNVISFQLNE